MNEFDNSAIGQAGGLSQGYFEGPKMAQQPTIKQRLDMAVQQAEQRLAAVKEARAIFERNPDMEKLLDIMQKAHF